MIIISAEDKYWIINISYVLLFLSLIGKKSVVSQQLVNKYKKCTVIFEDVF